ncbi:MAG: hypothetical protein JKY34_10010 [Kordiimonadaceae bacterium]|nr:hypothetical protein [Kordiimonadaceae bacterium]
MADYIVSSSNADAVAMLENWQNWQGHVAAVIGPKACGKSHLVQGWAEEQGALLIRPTDDIAAIPNQSLIVLDDADGENVGEEWLFHLFNWVKEVGGKLVLTAMEDPNRWSPDLPDLRSRLATVTVGRISEPDDLLLTALLVKLFSDRQLQVDLSVIDYALPRLERSFIAAHRFVERADESALAKGRKITKALVKNCF